jgi:hypothetical protein
LPCHGSGACASPAARPKVVVLPSGGSPPAGAAGSVPGRSPGHRHARPVPAAGQPGRRLPVGPGAAAMLGLGQLASVVDGSWPWQASPPPSPGRMLRLTSRAVTCAQRLPPRSGCPAGCCAATWRLRWPAYPPCPPGAARPGPEAAHRLTVQILALDPLRSTGGNSSGQIRPSARSTDSPSLRVYFRTDQSRASHLVRETSQAKYKYVFTHKPMSRNQVGKPVLRWPSRDRGPRTGTRQLHRPVALPRPGTRHAHHRGRRGRRSPARLPPYMAGLTLAARSRPLRRQRRCMSPACGPPRGTRPSPAVTSADWPPAGGMVTRLSQRHTTLTCNPLVISGRRTDPSTR